MTDLLALQPALPRLRSLRPASKVARLADSLNNIWLHFERLKILLHLNQADSRDDNFGNSSEKQRRVLERQILV